MPMFDELEDFKIVLETQAHKKILDMVEDYWTMKMVKRPFRPGVDSVPTSGKVIDSSDMKLLITAALEGWLTEGHWVDGFEKEMASYLNQRHGAMTNSGSSANLLAISALMSQRLQGRLNPGDRVVTTAAGFPTTINPILMNGLVPVFIDVQIGSYVPTVEMLQEGLAQEGVKAVMIAHTLGNPWPVNFVPHNKYWIIEDNCDALGSRLVGRRTGSFGHLATQSFYPAHHITTGEGGMVLGSEQLIQIVESLRDWGRDCWCAPGKDNTCGKRFEWNFPHLPAGYDHKYIYSEMGYNLKSTDLQGALGFSQISKIDQFNDIRKKNFDHLFHLFRFLDEFFILPVWGTSVEPSWFGFPLTVREDAPFDLPELEKFLAEKKIGSRRLFAGNYLRQPVFRNWLKSAKFHRNYLIMDSLENTEQIAKSTFWIGVWPGLNQKHLDYVVESFAEFIRIH